MKPPYQIMKTLLLSFTLTTLLVLGAANANDGARPRIYEMSVVWVYGTYPPDAEYFIVLSNKQHEFAAFRNVDDFKKSLKESYNGIILEWWPSDGAIGGEPLRSKEEVDKFTRFCSTNNVRLTIHPRG